MQNWNVPLPAQFSVRGEHASKAWAALPYRLEQVDLARTRDWRIRSSAGLAAARSPELRAEARSTAAVWRIETLNESTRCVICADARAHCVECHNGSSNAGNRAIGWGGISTGRLEAPQLMGALEIHSLDR